MRYLLLIPLMVTYLLASGDNPAKAFGTQINYSNPYRCFSDLGYHQNTTTEKISNAGITSACFPLTTTVNGCSMKWNWSIDFKNSSVTEANSSCQYACRYGNYGIHNQYYKLYPPVHTYRYCVKNADWTTVARCVDKQEGKEVDVSLCNSSGDSRYYWKPKCEPTDTTEECEKRMMSYTNWTMCSKTSEVNNTSAAGANSIYCYEYQRCYMQKNCDSQTNVLHSDYPSGGTPGETTKDPDKPTTYTGKLFLRDSWDMSNEQSSFIHTKMAGVTTSFRVYAIKDDGTKADSIQGQVTCQTFTLTTGTKTSGSYISGGANGEINLTTTIGGSGRYAVKCYVPGSATMTTGDVYFYAAPTSYEVNNLRLKSDGNLITIIDENTTKALGPNETYTIKHDSELWTKKPVSKLGSSISLVSNVYARDAIGNIDQGVNSSFFYGSSFQSQTISTKTDLKPTEFPNNLIDSNYGTIDVLTATAAMSYGELVDGVILSITGQDANIGKATLILQDIDVYTNVKKEETRGACGAGSVIECPYPGKLTIEFEYQIVPADFKILLLDENDKFIKVLYFGQGHTPEVEGKSNIKFVALNKVLPDTSTYDEIMAAVAKDFSTGKAAQDLQISSFENTSNTGQYHIQLSDGESVIRRYDFKDGVATIEKSLKVTKRKDEDFTPNMEAEPVFPDSTEMSGNAEFYGYPAATTSYPEYTDIKAASDEKMVILRGRINAIDSDTLSTAKTANDMIVYYEFQCKYCNLTEVMNVAGMTTMPKRSVTQQGWFVNNVFNQHSKVSLTDKMVTMEDKKLTVSSVGSFDTSNGYQLIHFGNNGQAGISTLKILHGNYCGTNYDDASACSDTKTTPVAMPNFLLWAPYYQATVKQHTSANIHIRNEVSPKDRSYGLDGPSSTKGSSRTGKF